MLGNYLQQTNSADIIFQRHLFLGALRVKAINTKFSNLKYLLGAGHMKIALLLFSHTAQSIFNTIFGVHGNGKCYMNCVIEGQFYKGII